MVSLLMMVLEPEKHDTKNQGEGNNVEALDNQAAVCTQMAIFIAEATAGYIHLSIEGLYGALGSLLTGERGTMRAEHYRRARELLV